MLVRQVLYHLSHSIHQPFLVLGIFENFLPGLASNHSPPDLCFPSSQDYRCEPLAPGIFFFVVPEFDFMVLCLLGRGFTA
jgi:hypothetical protein